MGAEKSKAFGNGDISEEDLRILTNLTPDELRQIYDNFMKSTSGQMDRQQFEDFYEHFFCNDKNKKFVDHLFRTFDFNGDGKVNFKEFVCGLSVTTRGTPDEKLTWTFNVYDVNQDGTITLDEMNEIMRAIYAINGITESEQLRFGNEAFEGLDANGDGYISVSEFVKGVKRDKRLVEFLDKTVVTVTK
ncbi:neurocalcin-like isoform X2 [Clavelina lepadiformis]|uniref:EF-hand domain-containing protein n=1 Tax=Clavelina lepadiformis TaxID=159417 RepID=A0ABP0GGG6_CLALP